MEWIIVVWKSYSNFTNWVSFSLKGLIQYLRRRHRIEEYWAGIVLADTGITSFDLTELMFRRVLPGGWCQCLSDDGRSKFLA